MKINFRYFNYFSRGLWSVQRKVDFGKYNVVSPGKVSQKLTIPDHIEKPSYYLTGYPKETINSPEVKNSEQIECMYNSCRLAATILNQVGNILKPGITTDEIDKFVHNKAIENNAYPSPFNYNHFPKSVCTSVNNVACHGIPDDRPLQDGDIVNVDITVYLNGYHGDCSKTFLVGDVDELGVELVKATETCLHEAISICKPGEYFNSIGYCIQEKARSLGYTIIPAFIGHGIGHYFHGPPDIYHFKNSYPGKMEAGMTFTIEPILTHGSENIMILEDNWTAVTLDKSRSAQYEHTILVTETGAEILTK